MLKFLRGKAKLQTELDIANQTAQALHDILMFATPDTLEEIQEYVSSHREDADIDKAINNMIAASEILI